MKMTLNDYNGLVYRYGEKGTEAIEGLKEEQKEIIILAWSQSENIEDPDEADEKINSYYKDFIKYGKTVEKQYTGYGYHGGGRPRKDKEARRKTISISGTPTEIENLKKLAKESGKTVSRFVLDNL